MSGHGECDPLTGKFLTYGNIEIYTKIILQNIQPILKENNFNKFNEIHEIFLKKIIQLELL